MKEKGQIILILILVMSVALAIGLSVVQRSLVDISTASKVEQSSRAFSAAEAGIEKALQENTTNIHSAQDFTSDNSSRIEGIYDSGLIPAIPAEGTQQDAIEKPTVDKEGIVQVWLADFNLATNPPDTVYKQNTLEVYWVTDQNDKPAIELTVVYWNGTEYTSTNTKKYIDPEGNRRTENGFEVPYDCNGYPIGTNTYQCKKTLTGLPDNLILLRARLLYNTASQSIAFQATGTCGHDCSFPPQDRKIISTGVAGETQRRIQIYQENKVVPPFFDYAVFSAGEVTK